MADIANIGDLLLGTKKLGQNHRIEGCVCVFPGVFLSVYGGTPGRKCPRSQVLLQELFVRVQYSLTRFFQILCVWKV